MTAHVESEPIELVRSCKSKVSEGQNKKSSNYKNVSNQNSYSGSHIPFTNRQYSAVPGSCSETSGNKDFTSVRVRKDHTEESSPKAKASSERQEFPQRSQDSSSESQVIRRTHHTPVRRLRPGSWQQTLAAVENRYDRAHGQAEQVVLRKFTQLQQRKISTSLKVESMQRKIESGVCKDELAAESQITHLKTELQDIQDHMDNLNKNMAETKHSLNYRRAREFETLQQLGAFESQSLGWQGLEEDSLPKIYITTSSSDPSIPDSVTANKDIGKAEESSWFTKLLNGPGDTSPFIRRRNPLRMLSNAFDNRRWRSRPKSADFSLIGESYEYTSPAEHNTSRYICDPPFTNVDITNTMIASSQEYKLEKRGSAPTTLLSNFVPKTKGNTGVQRNNTFHDVGDLKNNEERRRKAELRTEIHPDSLAEIAAFEALIDDYFMKHKRRLFFSKHDKNMVPQSTLSLQEVFP